MTVIDAGEAPVLVGMRPPGPRPKAQLSSDGRDNPFETIPLAAYEQPVWRIPSIFQRAWMVSDPAGIKQVLIDKVANYPKTDTENRLFRAAFGDGLLSRDGEPWRAHRRIMAPSFDPRSVAGYSAAMADASADFADGWAKLEDGAELEVEKVLYDHPAVSEAAIIAWPDEKWGEVPKAYVLLKPECSATAAELIDFCRGRLAHFKCPKLVEFGALPKTATGKIRKNELRERAWAGREKKVN